MMEEIGVYTTPTCPWCNKVKAYLNDKGVNYLEFNIATDSQAAQRIIEITGQRSVPVITKGDRYVVGFDPDRLESMIQ
jgi:glutaredoxin-like YruB-family protein